MELDASPLRTNYNIYIPQHPGGRPKEIAMFDDSIGGGQCRIKFTKARGCTGGAGDMSYTCDTEGGSSGSPVISHTTHKVIGLHHCGGGCNGNKGVPIRNFNNRISSYVSVFDTTSAPAAPTTSPPTPAPPTRSPVASLSVSSTASQPVNPGDVHCLKYGDSIILQVNNMNYRWLTGGYDDGQNEVDTRDFTGSKYFTYRWFVRSIDIDTTNSGSDPQSGNCVRYNEKVYIENHEMSGMWLRGGLETLKQGVKIGDRSGSKLKY